MTIGLPHHLSSAGMVMYGGRSFTPQSVAAAPTHSSKKRQYQSVQLGLRASKSGKPTGRSQRSTRVKAQAEAARARSTETTDKKTRRREQNRRAAIKSRKRKKLYVQELERKSAALEKSNRSLRLKLQALINENRKLRVDDPDFSPTPLSCAALNPLEEDTSEERVMAQQAERRRQNDSPSNFAGGIKDSGSSSDLAGPQAGGDDLTDRYRQDRALRFSKDPSLIGGGEAMITFPMSHDETKTPDPEMHRGIKRKHSWSLLPPDIGGSSSPQHSAFSRAAAEAAAVHSADFYYNDNSRLGFDPLPPAVGRVQQSGSSFKGAKDTQCRSVESVMGGGRNSPFDPLGFLVL